MAEVEKAEKEEARRLQEIAQKQERERAQKAKEEKEKADQLERERAQKAKEEKEKQLQAEREKAQRDKEERERQLQVEKEKAQKAKLERDKELALEKEKAQKAKEEREKQLQAEREKAQREKEEREKQKQQEKEKALLLKQQQKEKALAERQAKGGTETTSGGSKKYIFIGAGILILGLGIWLMTKGGPQKDDRTSWKEAMQKNDSTAYAQYMAAFPEGKYFDAAKGRIDSLYWAEKKVKDSLSAIQNVAVTETETTPAETTPPVETSPEIAKTPEVTKTPETTSKTKPNNTATKPKPTTTEKPKPNPTSTGKIALGQSYGGGIVIYVNAKGDHGMIVSSKEVGSVDYEKAQKICAAYKVGNISGWRLPSKDELNIIYQNRKHLGDYTKGNYWSATEEGKNSAMVQNFSNGNQSKSNKSSSCAVRAVRPF